MELNHFTLVHILISLAGIAAGFGVVSGLIGGKLFRGWTAFFLAMTAATSVTGFFFPFNGVTPGIVIGVISLPVLAAAAYALYARQLVGRWRAVFVFGTVFAQYLNLFVLIAQTFQKNPALVAIAPTQKEPPFAITQGIVLVVFVGLGVAALRRFRG